MAPVYGVTHQQVSDEVPNLFPGGFTQVTKPSAAQVEEWIAAADTLVRLSVLAATGLEPVPSTDASAPLARQYIRSSVIAYVMRAVYAGRASTEVDAAVRPYTDMAATLLASIGGMGGQASGTGVTVSRVRGEDGTRVRGMLVDDVDLHSDPTSVLSPWSGPPLGTTSSGRRGRY